MRLIDLVAKGDGGVTYGAVIKDLQISGLTSDSREVRDGFLFAALPGAKADGRTFIPDAVRRGAVAVLAPEGTRLEGSGPAVPVLHDPNPRRLFALMAARFFGRQPRRVVAVTGTNGKTSVSWFARQIWTHLGRQAASLGTVGIAAPGRMVPGSLTTPDPVELHRNLARLAEDGVECLAMEASSHGLDQFRLDGVQVAAAAFTNLTRDHLDYHRTMEAYLAAKQRLFSEVMAPGGVAVLNAETPEYPWMAELCARNNHRILTFGLDHGDFHCRARTPTPDGWRLEIAIGGRIHSVDLALLGEFQIANALAALALVLAHEKDEEAAVAALAHLGGVPGRMQRAGTAKQGAPIFVDYAHTPDALATVLRALRRHAAGRLHVVFGCGGDRDAGKRPEMGAIADDLADVVVVTDDNPRSEDPALIRRAILATCPRAREIPDRREAIDAAVRGLAAGDVLVIAGKGHEQGQIIGGRVLPFDDASAVREALQETGA